MSAPALFGFTKEEVGEKQSFAVPCYLVVHPKRTLMWDTGVVPDAQVNGSTQGISVVTKTLKSQMAEIGYTAADIKYLALSHLHSDHTANANDFAGSTWLVHQNERDAMFAPPPPPGAGRGRGGPQATATYDKLKDSKTVILTEKDGTVVIMYAPGHQVLFLRLKESGPILIAGDLLPSASGNHYAPFSNLRIRQGAICRFASKDRRFSETERRAAVDRTRSRYLHVAEEVAGVLRVSWSLEVSSGARSSAASRA
jgi:glyoxylase-like metal-dependent hydrolase (beta-lactamase superfamily II)